MVPKAGRSPPYLVSQSCSQNTNINLLSTSQSFLQGCLCPLQPGRRYDRNVSEFVAGRVVLNHTRAPLPLLPSGRVVDDVAEVAVPVPKMSSLFRALFEQRRCKFNGWIWTRMHIQSIHVITFRWLKSKRVYYWEFAVISSTSQHFKQYTCGICRDARLFERP